jgi:serine/threonine protein phosphatase PrpC
MVNDKIISANAGDSRAIIVNDMNTKYNVIQLCRDHKPDLKDEKDRILRNGGRVDKIYKFGYSSGPYRVFLKTHNYPGLAMSRSIGDFIAASVGVICDPGIYL